MKNDMINIYKWLSKFINIHLTTQEAQELGTRLIYIKNACTLNNFHKRPLITNNTFFFMKLFSRGVWLGGSGDFPRVFFIPSSWICVFFPDANLHSNILIQSEKLCLITRVSNM